MAGLPRGWETNRTGRILCMASALGSIFFTMVYLIPICPKPTAFWRAPIRVLATTRFLLSTRATSLTLLRCFRSPPMCRGISMTPETSSLSKRRYASW